MNDASPARLVIPTSAASPSSTTNLPTGRPALWTNSSQRKMCRLYVYSTLSIEKIVELVHRRHHGQHVPGKDSANKKLNALLDKEPRWLKPKSEEDMFRRVQQLDHSPTRTTAIPWPSPFTRTHSHSAPPPFSLAEVNATPIKREYEPPSATLEVPPWPHSPLHGASTPQGFAVMHGRTASDEFGGPNVTARLLRSSSGLSTASDQTTGSLQEMLEGYSPTYVHCIRRLLKRYTAPSGAQEMGTSPMSDMTPGASWTHDLDASPPFNNRPFALPGDLLGIDLHLQRQNECYSKLECLKKTTCMCQIAEELPEEVWVTAQGPTPFAMELLQYGMAARHAEARDAFGNTALHFIAARGSQQVLIDLVQQGICWPILNARNNAGQTFLHVLGEQWLHNEDTNLLFHLLDLLAHQPLAMGQLFDIAARDQYGRTFFHYLCSANIPPVVLEFTLQRYGRFCHRCRDAFDWKPMSADLVPPTENMQVDSAPTENQHFTFKDSRMLRLVREASTEPLLEDDDGRNGLHCLAMASLSQRGVMDKASLSPATPSSGRQRKRGKAPDEILDSSTEKLQFRLNLVNSLLEAGVDPNHYDVYGNTPLMAFCAELPEDDDYKLGPTIIETLIARGADINARNRAGESALHVAVRCGRKLAVKTLVDHKANVHARDSAGRGVLALADVKMKACAEDNAVDYCHYEACRAHLSGKGYAVQEPSLVQEWGNFS